MNTKMKRSTATWIWDFAGEYRSRYVLSVLSAVCGVICGILPYFVMANMIGDLLGGCRDTNIYLQHCLVMALLWVGRCGFHSISTTLSHKATFAVLGNIRKRVCEKLTRVPLGTVLDMPSGSVKKCAGGAHRQHRNHDGTYHPGIYIKPAGAYCPAGVSLCTGLAHGSGCAGNSAHRIRVLCRNDPWLCGKLSEHRG